jgi:hypothetical protein
MAHAGKPIAACRLPESCLAEHLRRSCLCLATADTLESFRNLGSPTTSGLYTSVLVQLLMSRWTAIHSLVSRPSGGAAHLKLFPPCYSRAIVAGEASLRCPPANADEAPVVRSIQLAAVVLRCWPIRTLRLRTQGHQPTNTTDDPY